MAARSEAVTWKRLGIPPADRVCAVCGKQMRLEDLRQYHVKEGPPKTLRIACKTCGPVLA